MKKAMIRTGLFSAIATITGSFFKIMNWPAAGILLLLGIGTLALIFIPLLFILKTKDDTAERNKLITGFACLIGILLCCATLFAVMHWPTPANGFFWIAAICVSTFALIPVYFFTGIRNPETRLNTIVTTIILIGATGLQFTLVNIRPAKKQTEIKLYSYLQSERLLKKMQKNPQNQSPLTTDINSTAEKIKALILTNTLGDASLINHLNNKELKMQDENLGSGFNENEAGVIMLNRLHSLLNEFNYIQLNPDNKIPVEMLEVERISAYSNFVVLNYLVQVQMALSTAEMPTTAMVSGLSNRNITD